MLLVYQIANKKYLTVNSLSCTSPGKGMSPVPCLQYWRRIAPPKWLYAAPAHSHQSSSWPKSKVWNNVMAGNMDKSTHKIFYKPTLQLSDRKTYLCQLEMHAEIPEKYKIKPVSVPTFANAHAGPHIKHLHFYIPRNSLFGYALLSRVLNNWN